MDAPASSSASHDPAPTKAESSATPTTEPTQDPAQDPAQNSDQDATRFESNPFKLIKPSWEAFRRCWLGLLLLWLLAFGVGAFAAVVAVGSLIIGTVLLRGSGLAGNLVLLAFAIVGVAVLVYASAVSQWITVRLLLGATRGQKLNLDQAFPRKWQEPLRLLWAELIAGLAVIAGLICLVVPGLLMLVWFAYVPNVVVEEGLTGWAAVQRSRALVKGHFWEVVSSATLLYVVYVFNYIPFLGGLIYFACSLVVMAVPFLRYVQLKALADRPDTKTNFSWLNILVVVLAIGAMGYDGVTQYQALHKTLQLEKSAQ